MRHQIPELPVAIAAEITASLASSGQLTPDQTVPFFAAAAQRICAILGASPEDPHMSHPNAIPAPAVPVEASVNPDRLICLEDGKPMKMLKRYLRRRYGLTPEEYRAKWGLPPSYPMIAPNARLQRSANARLSGLGTYPRRRQGCKGGTE